MRELNIIEASWSMDASGSWLKLRPELPGQAQMVAGEMDPQKKYTVTIKEFRKKRSLDANAYAWVLMNKLADKLNMGVRDLYRHYIPDIPENSQLVQRHTQVKAPRLHERCFVLRKLHVRPEANGRAARSYH